jgi:hypothetical protein
LAAELIDSFVLLTLLEKPRRPDRWLAGFVPKNRTPPNGRIRFSGLDLAKVFSKQLKKKQNIRGTNMAPSLRRGVAR